MSTPAWYLDELRFAGPEHLDPAFVAAYDAKQQTDWTPDVRLLRKLGLDRTRTVVDIGAGTGAFDLALAPFARRVVAVDISPAMLAIIRERATVAQAKNLECVQAGFMSYQHSGPPADFVYTRNALHHLPDFWKGLALERIAAMLKPGGVLRLRDIVYGFPLEETETRIGAWLAAAKSDPKLGYTRQEYETHLHDEYSTYSWLLEPLLERAGFALEEVDFTPNRLYAAYVCVKR